ncbi:MAG: DUF4251 domain-containing protein [Rikenellaceae bacterium]
MKKLLLLLTVCLLTIGSATAQKKSKEEKAAEKAKLEAENKVLYSRLFNSTNFVFVPQSWQTKSGGRNNVTGYYYSRVRPDGFQVDMPGVSEIEIKDNFEITDNEETKTGFRLVVSFEDAGTKYTFDFAVNSATGRAALRVKSNKAEDVTYTGTIREN